MLMMFDSQVRENEISLRKWSGGTAQLRTLGGPLIKNHWLKQKQSSAVLWYKPQKEQMIDSVW